MARYIPIAKPKADLTPVSAEPAKHADGTETQTFRTAFGQFFVRVVEPNGEVRWLQEVD